MKKLLKENYNAIITPKKVNNNFHILIYVQSVFQFPQQSDKIFILCSFNLEPYKVHTLRIP